MDIFYLLDKYVTIVVWSLPKSQQLDAFVGPNAILDWFQKAVDFSQLSNLWKLWINWPVSMTVWFSGSSLDTLARRPLWQYGLDFGHGTGHGIGMFLNVHEGKALILSYLYFVMTSKISLFTTSVSCLLVLWTYWRWHSPSIKLIQPSAGSNKATGYRKYCTKSYIVQY